MLEEHLLGYLWLWGNRLSAADLPVLSIFAKQIGLSLERARLFQEVQELALTDPLTNLLNRRSLFELGRIEFLRSRRGDRPFSGAMLDLDHFKRINDTYGHPTGDRVLQEIARRCKELVREIDLLGRYGGEELILLMPETPLVIATKVAERLRQQIQDVTVPLGEINESITISVGVATKDEYTPDLETLIARADQAMYIAKHRGRNRVAVSK
jgi:diguanylate cyclase (GGDEF)-like protein